MVALTDKEIIEALPAESRHRIDSAFEALAQSQPSDRERLILYRVAHTLKLNPTDTHFSVMAAMHYYLQLYQLIPDKIVQASGSAMADHVSTLKAQADLIVSESKGALIDMVRKSVSETVSDVVSQAAVRISADRVAAERNKFFWLATAATVICALVFGGTGYTLRMTSDAVNVSSAKERADRSIAAAQQMARDEIETARRNSGWVGTSEGRLAKAFFDSGGGLIAARCNSPVWEVVETSGGRYCVPKRRDLFSVDDKQYGWKIP